MKHNKVLLGHVLAFFTIIVWGTTYISTKVLLRDFTPIEILFTRFTIAYLVLWLVYPRKLAFVNWRQEGLYAAAGLCGVTLYFLFENVALTYTNASNVGVIGAVAPFFTAIFGCILLHNKRPNKRFFLGFVIAMVGISLISFNGESVEVNPFGDFLAAIGAIVWAIYSIISKKLSSYGHNTIQTTRRTFFYGIIFMIPVLFFMDFNLTISMFNDISNILNLLFLGFCASAIGFVTWNYAVKVLGAVKTSNYIYMTPVVTTVTSIIVLHEKINFIAAVGIALTLIGLFLSESKREQS